MVAMILVSIVEKRESNRTSPGGVLSQPLRVPRR
jgi:hypothetical protein